jgi:hypothetical protein
MTLDNLGNMADVIAIPLAVFGLILILHQLKLTRLESQKEHNRRQNEMTFNAYNTVRSDLRETIHRIRKKLKLEDMFDKFSDEHLHQITNDKELRDDVAKMLGFLNKFAVGIKYDVFSIGLVNDLSGKLFIETYRQFKPYIDWVRKDYDTFYVDYENLVLELKRLRNYKD